VGDAPENRSLTSAPAVSRAPRPAPPREPTTADRLDAADLRDEIARERAAEQRRRAAAYRMLAAQQRGLAAADRAAAAADRLRAASDRAEALADRQALARALAGATQARPA
jgi:hypothetical protein